MKNSKIVAFLAALALTLPASSALALSGGQKAGADDALADSIVYLSLPNPCTGTLVAPSWVLTAAHCALEGPGPMKGKAVLGRLSSLEAKDQATVDFFVSASDSDIALAHLKNPAVDRPVAQIATANPDYSSHVETVCLMTRAK